MIDYRECALEILPSYEYREGVKSDYFKVKENFDKVLETLGDLNPEDLIVNIDLRLMNKYGNYESIQNVCKAIWVKTSLYFLKKNIKHGKLPFVRAIEDKEQTRGFIKSHAHLMIRLTGLPKIYHEQEVVDKILDICYSLKEVNSKDRKKDQPPVRVRTIPFCVDTYNTLGKRIVYICKTSTNNNNPLSEGLF